MADFQIQGLDAVLKKMRALPVDVRKKGARFAGRKAANLIKDAAVQNAARIDDPATRDEIAKNIAVRFSNRTFKRTGDIMFRIGLLGGARQADENEGNPGGKTFHWRFVELGTETMPARPFMRPAATENAEAAASEFTSQLNRWLDRYYRKQGIAPPA